MLQLGRFFISFGKQLNNRGDKQKRSVPSVIAHNRFDSLCCDGGTLSILPLLSETYQEIPGLGTSQNIILKENKIK